MKPKRSIQKYDRHSTIYDVAPILKQIELTDSRQKESIEVNGVTVGIYSLRLQTFAKTGLSCCSCGLTATYFAIERDLAVATKGGSYHLNLWGVDESGEEVLFTCDHTLARGLGGVNNLNNTSTMCCHCNWEKGNLEAVQVQQAKITEEVLKLMTPPEILQLTEFERAWPILPERFPTFKDLLKWRDSIRNLILLPVKSDEMRAYYNALDKSELSRNVWEKFGDQRFMFSENEFPYMVPKGMKQFIIWIKDPLESRENVAAYIVSIIEQNHFSLKTLILFERPIGITTALVRGTFPQIRHVHLWTRG